VSETRADDKKRRRTRQSQSQRRWNGRHGGRLTGVMSHTAHSQNWVQCEQHRSWQSLEEVAVTGRGGSHWKRWQSLEEVAVTGRGGSHWQRMQQQSSTGKGTNQREQMAGLESKSPPAVEAPTSLLEACLNPLRACLTHSTRSACSPACRSIHHLTQSGALHDASCFTRRGCFACLVDASRQPRRCIKTASSMHQTASRPARRCIQTTR
jgi:hypothetical protein